MIVVKKYEEIGAIDSTSLGLLVKYFELGSFVEFNFSKPLFFDNIYKKYSIGIVAKNTYNNYDLYLTKSELKDTIDDLHKTPKKSINWYLLVVMQNKILSIIHLSECHKDLWYGLHVEFKIYKNKIYQKYILDYSDEISDDEPKDGIFEKNVLEILPNGHTKTTSKWEYKRKKY